MAGRQREQFCHRYEPWNSHSWQQVSAYEENGQKKLDLATEVPLVGIGQGGPGVEAPYIIPCA